MQSRLCDPSVEGWLAPESRPIVMDGRALLEVGETMSGASSTLVDMATGADVSSASLTGSPTISGTTISQTVHSLTVGHDYLLTYVFNAGGKTWGMQVVLHCDL